MIAIVDFVHKIFYLKIHTNTDLCYIMVHSNVRNVFHQIERFPIGRLEYLQRHFRLRIKIFQLEFKYYEKNNLISCTLMSNQTILKVNTFRNFYAEYLCEL